MHIALYRKYRPKIFNEVVGQKMVVQSLKNQVASGKIGHAFLFTGTRGTGKTSCAKIFAKAINCINNKNGEPCMECDICRGIENESIYDVTEMDAASNNSVEDIRDILSEVMYLPVMAKYKVYIIDEVHMLSSAAFNALLKTLEEPPAHVVFILATTELHKVPATILSRCQRYDFNKLSIEEIGEALLQIAKREEIQLSTGAAKIIASLADGAMRDATSILDTCLSNSNTIDEELVANIVGISKQNEIFALAKCLIEKDMPGAMQNLLLLEEKSVDIKRLTEELITHFRNLLLAGLVGSTAQLLGITDDSFAAANQQSKTTSQAFISQALAAFTTALDSMSKGQTPKIAMDIAVFNLCNQQTMAPSVYINTPSANQYHAPSVKVTKITEEIPPEKQDILPKDEQLSHEKAEVPIPFKYWQQVIEKMKEYDIPLYTFIKDSTAYLYNNIVYIDGNEGLNSCIRTNKEAGVLIKKCILEVCKKAYNIGGYKNIAKNFEEKKTSNLEPILALRKNGVEVNIED